VATRGPIYITKVYKHGNSLVMTLERDLRNKLRVVEGDYVMIKLHEPFATLRRADPNLAVPFTDVSAGDLPPAWPRGVKRAGPAIDPARAAAGTTGPDEGTD
jgi:hypothetical protein